MVLVRAWAQDSRRNRTLAWEQQFADWGSAALWLATLAEQRVGLVYEIEAYTNAPGDEE